MKNAPAPTLAQRTRANDKPLVEDIRLLGRLLGEVIREQEGQSACDLIENIRTLSVAFRRDADHAADQSLKKLLKGLSGDQTVSVIRAFTYFSHLANLAEDRHHIRRRAVHERTGDTQEGSLEVAMSRLRWAGITAKTIANTLAHSYVSPVLTAHPTEVQRKSILDAERSIAALLVERDEIRLRGAAYDSKKDALTPRELATNEAQMRARVMQLWQTRLLRYSKLTVADEVENALSYYESTFLHEIPKLYANLEQLLGQHPVHSFLRMGQWIGGDRDGNPNVSAETLEYALRRQAEVALRHYLTEVHFLGSELSVSAMLVDCTPAMKALAQSSPDQNAHRMDEPYRRALTGIYARLAATLKSLTGTEAARHAVAPQNAYRLAADFVADLRTIEASLQAHHGGALTPQRLHPLIRAVEVFGFHLATVDLRQSSDKHEEVVAELLAYRDAGIQVAIDDFGTGYSAMSYLKQLDIDYLKIDQLFVNALTTDASDRAMCEAMVVMAHALGLKVIAEGVETVEQREVLQAMGCDYAQGFLFAKALPAPEFEVLMRSALAVSR